ncbi:MAG: hypothetical protein A3B38_02285 [Candidatus Levybacteria bacterium RIFCSPLOWO2_01_FULL_36_13]|nr:MAG: hypothetical protein A2684_00940 [Candidatus Levybacteria bacterium RIFCSPHIGHO2_01_FULL_36_15b]OGH34924.1 MAG: hypothetical protein A3B38_02285 [Candidatus Levybacteria bacterium RIFCSPLOWO2_01_FULL_36_13]
MKIKIITSLIFIFSLALLVTPVLAEKNNPDNISVVRRADAQERVEEKIQAVRENTKLRLEGAKLRTCQVREDAVNKRINNLVRLTENMETKFSSISARVIEYYETKVLPDKSLSNYQELIDEIATKKAAVDSALDSAQSSVGSFSCESDDPKNMYTTFRENMQTVKNALKEYRTSIKNLIVAIRTLNSEEESE